MQARMALTRRLSRKCAERYTARLEHDTVHPPENRTLVVVEVLAAELTQRMPTKRARHAANVAVNLQLRVIQSRLRKANKRTTIPNSD